MFGSVIEERIPLVDYLVLGDDLQWWRMNAPVGSDDDGTEAVGFGFRNPTYPTPALGVVPM